jgi:hypothetical protein
VLNRDDPAFHELLTQISNAVFSRYVENPHAVYGPLYVKAGKGELGVGFESLSRGERVELLTELVDWGHYLVQGIGEDQLNAIFKNVIGGKWPHKWCDGVFDRTPEQQAFQDILLGEHPRQQEVKTQERGSRGI